MSQSNLQIKFEHYLFKISSIHYLLHMVGNVYIGAMNMRGIRAPLPHPNIKILNVTSAQATDKPERTELSPMSAVIGKYKGYFCFENYWQAGKIIEGIDRQTQLKWWKSQKSGKRRYPNSKGKRILYSEFDGIQRDYITSRKEIYVPLYYDLVKQKHVLAKWRKILEQYDIIVYDFDGPRNDNNEPITLEVTTEMLQEKINDPLHPFGHGYVVAGILANIHPAQYIA